MTYEWHTSTYEWHWHADDIRVTYEWHASTYEWHMDQIQVHTSDIRMTYEYIRVKYGWCASTYEWHAADIRITCGRKKNWLFKSCLIILFQCIWFVKAFVTYSGCFGLFTKIKKGSGISFRCTFCAWFFHTNLPYLILYQLRKFQRHIFFKRNQSNYVIKFLFRQSMTS